MNIWEKYGVWIFRVCMILYSIFLLSGILGFVHAAMVDYSSGFSGVEAYTDLDYYAAGGSIIWAGILFFIATLSIYPKIKNKLYIIFTIFALLLLIIIGGIVSSPNGSFFSAIFVLLIYIITQYFILLKIYRRCITSNKRIISILLTISLILGLLAYIVPIILCATIIGILFAIPAYGLIITLWVLYNVIISILFAILVKSKTNT